ncbi:MAG: hypothetical protein R3C10_23380 [Pirellulales bacterium]
MIEDVVKPKRAADSTLVRLSCVDDDNQGQPLEVLWEKEIDPTILGAEAWETVATKGFDDSRLFAPYLNTLKWNCVTSTDTRLFQSPFRAGIRLDAHQREPLRKALRMSRVNLFIADVTVRRRAAAEFIDTRHLSDSVVADDLCHNVTCDDGCSSTRIIHENAVVGGVRLTIRTVDRSKQVFGILVGNVIVVD